MSRRCQNVMTAAVKCFVRGASLEAVQGSVEAGIEPHAVHGSNVSQERLMAGQKNIVAVLANNGEQEIPLVVTVIAGVIALGASILLLVRHLEEKRTAALGLIAAEIGLAFTATQGDDLLGREQVFTLFNKGHSRKMRNVMKAEGQDTTLAVF